LKDIGADRICLVALGIFEARMKDINHHLSASPRLDWAHTVSDIPASGLKVRRAATDSERGALAADLDIVACSRLEVGYEIRSLSSGRYLLTGYLEADVVQSCVVTLEPVGEELKESFEAEFQPPDELATARSHDLDPFETKEIEPLSDGHIAVGRVVYEQIAAALDPYPRAAGATFSWTEPESSAQRGAAQGPFDVLKQLRPKT
jgi:uncharacterized metal-binding protein YceD (DUF177 family)